jgi:hypothetical protein
VPAGTSYSDNPRDSSWPAHLEVEIFPLVIIILIKPFANKSQQEEKKMAKPKYTAKIKVCAN